MQVRSIVLVLLLSFGTSAFGQSNDDFVGLEPTRPSKPTPRTADGHPDFSGYWKGSRATKPVGNIGKDLPGFKLPLTAAGEQALKHNLTETIDPESLCILGGIPRHNASGLPFMVQQSANAVTFLYFYSYYRLIPVDGRKHSEDPDPSFFGEETEVISMPRSRASSSALTRLMPPTRDSSRPAVKAAVSSAVLRDARSPL